MLFVSHSDVLSLCYTMQTTFAVDRHHNSKWIKEHQNTQGIQRQDLFWCFLPYSCLGSVDEGIRENQNMICWIYFSVQILRQIMEAMWRADRIQKRNRIVKESVVHTRTWFVVVTTTCVVVLFCIILEQKNDGEYLLMITVACQDRFIPDTRGNSVDDTQK